MTSAGGPATIALAGDELGSGIGPPVVLVHGIGGSRHIWDDVVGSIAAAHRVVRLELRGHGETGGPSDPGEYNLPVAAADLARAVRDRGLERPTVVAHSLGGTVTLWAALRHRLLFGRLVLVNAFASGIGPARAKVVKQQIETYAKLGAERMWELMLPLRESDEFLGRRFRSEPDFVEMRRREALETLPAAFEGFGRDLISRPSFVSWLWQLQTHVMLLAGAGDVAMLPAMQAIETVLRDGELRVLGGCGHNVMMEIPDEFAVSLLGVLDESVQAESDPLNT